MSIISFFFCVAHLEMSSIVCACVFYMCIYTQMYVCSVSGTMFAQAALGGKIINHGVHCEQVIAI